MVRFFLFIVVFFATATNCFAQPNPGVANDFLLTGYLQGRDTGIIVLQYPTVSGIWIRDTAHLQNNNFTFKGKVNQPTFCNLRGSAGDGNYAEIFLEGGSQHIQLREDNFNKFKMTGSKSQYESDSLDAKTEIIRFKYKRLYNEYDSLAKIERSEQDTLVKRLINAKISTVRGKIRVVEKKMIDETILFIKTHPASFVSPTQLYGFLMTKKVTTREADILFSGFASVTKQGRVGQILNQEIERRSINIKADNFTAPDWKGKSVELYQLNGNYVLLVFWASWCIPCREELPYLKKLYNEYKGNDFKVVTISVDRNAKDWIQAIKKDSLENWINVIANDNIRKAYSNPGLPIPSLILINRKGIIVWNSVNSNNSYTEDMQILNRLLSK